MRSACEEVQEGGDICTHRADPLPFTAETNTTLLSAWAPKSLQVVTAAMKLKDACSWKKSYGQSRQLIKKQRLDFADKSPSSQSYGFSSSHVWMRELEHKED